VPGPAPGSAGDGGGDTGSAPLRVAFVGGHGRSGSTLLTRVLGEVPSFCAVGELRYLWRQGVRGNRMCGCRARFHACPFWQAVGRAAFGGWDRVDAREVVALQRSLERNRYAPLLLAPRLSPTFARRLRRYAEITGALYRGVAEASGCEVVVDASKSPSSALVLRHVPGVDPRLVHLVRNPYGVAYSWSRQVERADRGGRLMAQHSPARTSLEWSGFNLAFDALPALGVPRTLVRYEDLVTDPAGELGRVLGFLGAPVADPAGDPRLSFLGDRTATLSAGHTVAGNPMRLETGEQRLVLDERWRTDLPPRARRVVTPLTAPGALRYGYHAPAGARRPPQP
jgi:hypothetical protein